MSFALFVSVVPDEPDSPVKVRPDRVFAITQDPERDDVCELHVPGGVFVVRGNVEEVSAALEAAGAPAVAPVVEVAPTDLEMAAQVLEVVASEIEDDELDHLAARINNKIGTRYDVTRFDGAISRLIALAAKLRGGGR